MAQTDEGHIRDALKAQNDLLRHIVETFFTAEERKSMTPFLAVAQNHIDDIRVVGDARRREEALTQFNEEDR